jgi:hypothetical protein
MMRLSTILICLFSCFQNGIFAQEIDPDDSFTFELSLPNSINNKPYKTIMQGLVQSSAQYQYTLKNGLSFASGIHYTYFAINEFRVPSKVYGGIHTAAAYIKVGHEKFWSERFGTDFGVKIGYSNAFFITDKNKTNLGRPNSVNSIFVEPTAAVVLTAGEFTAYKFVVGYMFQGYDYNTQQLGITATGGYKPADLNHATQFMTFGFGFTYYFKQY